MLRATVLALCIATLPAPPAGAEGVAPLHAETRAIAVTVGETAEVSAETNPSTGAAWRLNETASRNLAILDIEALGTAAAGETEGDLPIVGAPMVATWAVTGRTAGKARIVLDYGQPWRPEDIWRRLEIAVTVAAPGSDGS